MCLQRHIGSAPGEESGRERKGQRESREIKELQLEGRAERARKLGAGNSGGTTALVQGVASGAERGLGEHCRQFRVRPGRVGHQPTARGDG
ncbi:unnamed protein product [Ectocarpus sp. 13 AM-2016]